MFAFLKMTKNLGKFKKNDISLCVQQYQQPRFGIKKILKNHMVKEESVV